MKTEQGPHERSHFHEQHATNRWLRGKESRTSKVKMDGGDRKGNLGIDPKRLTTSLKTCRARLGKGITQKPNYQTCHEFKQTAQPPRGQCETGAIEARWW